MKTIRSLVILSMVCIGGAVSAQQCVCTNYHSFNDYPGCLDKFNTAAVFKIVYVGMVGNGGPVITMTVRGLSDGNTSVGRSDPFWELNETNQPARAITCVTNYPGTAPTASDPICRLPDGFPEGDATRREVHTEILSLQLTNDSTPINIQIGDTTTNRVNPGSIVIRAGTPYFLDWQTNGPPGYYKNSFGEVASLCCGWPTNLAADFPAKSFFHVYAMVTVNLPGLLNTKLYNKAPMVLSSQITQFPPDLNLPQSTYIHDPSFATVALYDANGILVAYLLSAGHGGSTNVANLRADAPQLNKYPVCFSGAISNLCNTNGAAPTSSPNDASNPRPADRTTSIYESSGLNVGQPPDTTNIRLPGLPPSAGFVAGDALRSFSFGRDGTGNPYDPHWCLYNTNPGSLYFSVSCSSTGAFCTDLNINAMAQGAAADVYASGAPNFGAYTNAPAFLVRSNDNLLAIDAQQLGLAPGDNVTGLQMKLFNSTATDTNHDWLYVTMSGPSFPSDGATIYVFDPTNSSFSKAALSRFAGASDLGLNTNDIIDALVLSDLAPGRCPRRPNQTLDAGTNGAVEYDQVLFSLAPGSPTLAARGLSAADVLYSKFDGTFSVFAGYASLGLLATDDVDALVIQPGMPMALTCTVEPTNQSVYVGSSAGFVGIPYGLPPYFFQWYSNGVAIGGATNATYTNPPAQLPGTVTFTLIASNAYSASTNNAVLSVQTPTNAPVWVRQPWPEVKVYAGASPTFSVQASGNPTPQYQWLRNSVAIPGATGASYVLANAQFLDSGAMFSCIASNSGGVITSSNATLTVLATPVQGYPSAVLADSPVAYWRLDEGPDDGAGNNGTVAHDYRGGHNGAYLNSTLGMPGYSMQDPDTAAAFSGTNSYVGSISGSEIDFAGHTNFTLEAWVQGPPGLGDQSTIIAKGHGSGGTAPNEQFALDVFAGLYRFFARSSANGLYEAIATTGPDGTWQHVVGVYNDSSSTLSVYVNGQLQGNSGTPGAGVRASSDPVSIGSKRLGISPAYDGTFEGTVDEVAVYNYALSAATVQNHYNSAFGVTRPTISQQPTSLTVTQGNGASFTVGATGTAPISYQWRYYGANLAGATSNMLTYPSAQQTNAGNYDVIVANAGGAVTSAVAVLTVKSLGADLFIRDDPLDVGNEPNNDSKIYWASDDIWVRRQPDPNFDPAPFPTAKPAWTPQAYEDPCYRDPEFSTPNYIYVRVRNIGTQNSSGNDVLHVYWAKASTGLGWPKEWNDYFETPSCNATPRLYGFEVTKPRKNGATATAQEISDYVAAVQGARGMNFADGVSHFDKQATVHGLLFQAGIHGTLWFLPWHREFCNRYEVLLREVKPAVTLLYWDWTTNPDPTITGAGGFMGVSKGLVGAPFNGWGVSRYVSPMLPGNYTPGLAAAYQAGTLLPSADFPTLWVNMEAPCHNGAHRYLGLTGGTGNIMATSSPSDPIFWMLHANADRLWSKWQRANSADVSRWRPTHAYDPKQKDALISTDLVPWSGQTTLPNPPGPTTIRPWTAGDGYVTHKAPAHDSIVYPPIYDDALLKVPVLKPDSCCIIEIPFYPPSPVECNGFKDPTHVCLLARIEPVNVAEGPNLLLNVKNNKRIAWRNTHVADCNPGPWFSGKSGRIGCAGELCRNWRTNPAICSLRFDALPVAGRTCFDFGTVRLRCEDVIYQAWVNGGRQGSNVQDAGTNNEVLVLAPGALMAGMALAPRGVGRIDAALDLNRGYNAPTGAVYYLEMVQLDDQGGTNSTGGQRIDLDFNSLSLLQKGSTWRFLEGGQSLPPNWYSSSYDDSAWMSGNALIGYGRSDALTTLVGSINRPAPAYFRQTFTVADPTFYSSLNLNLLVDDGVVVYLNGQEVARLNMPNGTVTPATPALSAVTGAASRAYRTVAGIPTSLLVAGVNLLAAEVHPATNGNPADLSYDLEVAANAPTTPYQSPAVVINSPTNGGVAAIGSDVPIQADVFAPDGNLAVVNIYTNGTLLISLSNAPFSTSFAAPPLGANQVSVEALDQAGHVTRVEALFSVVTNLLPIVVMNVPTNNPSFPYGAPVPVMASASDPDGSVAQVALYVQPHAFAGSPTLLRVATNAPYSAVATNLPPGPYMAYAVATDNRGGVSYALPAHFVIGEPPGTPDLRIQLNDVGNGPYLTLQWDEISAVLEHSTNVVGPWSSLTGASSPFSVVPALKAEFFRLRLQ